MGGRFRERAFDSTTCPSRHEVRSSRPTTFSTRLPPFPSTAAAIRGGRSASSVDYFPLPLCFSQHSRSVGPCLRRIPSRLRIPVDGRDVCPGPVPWRATGSSFARRALPPSHPRYVVTIDPRKARIVMHGCCSAFFKYPSCSVVLRVATCIHIICTVREIITLVGDPCVGSSGGTNRCCVITAFMCMKF